MLIRDYCYDGGQIGEGGLCGNPDPALVGQWKRWKDHLPLSKQALLDMPSNNNNRVILFSLGGTQVGVVGFTIPCSELPESSDIYFLYKAILALNPETIASAIATNEPIDILVNPEQLESPPVPAVFADINGLQMIGSIDKALAVITRLLPKKDYSRWAQSYFLAINPIKYADEFSTVVSEDTPSGEWQKLKSEHTEYPTSFAFQCRRRAWIKRRLAPQLLFFSSVAILSILAWGLTIFFSVRECHRLREKSAQLEKHLESDAFKMRDLQHSLKRRKEENSRLQKEIRKLEKSLRDINTVKTINQ